MRLSFDLQLPRHWAGNHHHPLKINFSRHGYFFSIPNQYWEVQITSFLWTSLFDFEFWLSSRTDHAGLNVNFTILGVFFSFQVYDGRHWNSKEDRWYLPGEEEELWGKPQNPDILASPEYALAIDYMNRRAESQRHKDDPVSIIQGLLNQIERTE